VRPLPAALSPRGSVRRRESIRRRPREGRGGASPCFGTDDNDPYRVFHEVAGIAPGTPIQYRATVLDNAGHTRTSDPVEIDVAAPSVTLTAPPQDGRVRENARLTAEVTPDDNDNSVRFERSVDGGAFTTVGSDSSQPVYTMADDVSALAPGTPVAYRAVLTYASGQTVTSAVRTVTVVEPVTTATIHYNRPDGNYGQWGLHLFGPAPAAAEATAEWTNATAFEGTDTYGVFHEIEIADDTKQVGFVVHGRQPGGGNPDTKDPNNSPDLLLHADRPPGNLAEGGRLDDLLLAAAALVTPRAHEPALVRETRRAGRDRACRASPGPGRRDGERGGAGPPEVSTGSSAGRAALTHSHIGI